MAIFLIISLVIVLIAVIFAVQNAAPVTVALLQFKFESSLALVLLSTFAAGVLVGLIGLTPTLLKRRVEVARLKKNLQQLQKSGGKPEPDQDSDEHPLPPLA